MAVPAPLTTSSPQFPNWAAQAALVEDLPGGLTNVNYRVTNPAGERFVVRRWSATAALLAIDRGNEHHNARAAAEAGVGGGVVAFLPEQGCQVVRYVEGRC